MRKAVIVAGLALLAGGCAPASLLEEASSATSQTLCTATFVSGVPADDSFQLEVRPEPGVGLIAWAIHYDVDRMQHAVSTTVAGAFPTRSVFEKGRGCTRAYDGYGLAPLKARAPAAAELPDIADAAVVTASDPAVGAAVDRAFAETEGTRPRNTAAVIVVRDGRVIGERYRAGYGVNQALLGHSLAKSVVNALLGILVRQGKLDVHAPAGLAEWQGDARRAITIEQLMRMDAGFGFDEGSGAGIATHMWYAEPDTAAFAATAELQTEPGSAWGYSSRGYTLLSRILGAAIGGGPQGVRDFATRELFGPLGMRHVTLEFDASGTLMGAQAVLASPRDWAKFGLLYLNDGVVNGRRILPAGWVAFSATPTLNTGYGAGFWLNTTHAQMESWRMSWGLPGVPADAFFARGYLGQYIVIVPSQRLVVVRFGYAHGPGADGDGVAALVRDVIAATRASATAMRR